MVTSTFFASEAMLSVARRSSSEGFSPTVTVMAVVFDLPFSGVKSTQSASTLAVQSQFALTLICCVEPLESKLRTSVPVSMASASCGSLCVQAPRARSAEAMVNMYFFIFIYFYIS